MELEVILDRFVDGLKFVDSNTTFVSANRRTGEVYLPGVKTLPERQFVKEVRDWWIKSHAEDFKSTNSIDLEVPYPGLPRASCDIMLSTGDEVRTNPEWLIEVKHIALVGNNGKNNDFGVAKILSPYLKDRSLIHDIFRMQEFGFSKRKAVIGYCFSYTETSIYEARLKHPKHSEYVDNIEGVCKSNDPVGLEYTVIPMVEFADSIFRQRELVSNLIIKKFDGAWRHPCGGSGVIFGWELTNRA